MNPDLPKASGRDIQVAAAFAETLVSQEYNDAMTAAFEAAPTVEDYLDHRSAAQQLIVTAMRTEADEDKRAWDLRRQASLTELGGTSLGGFSDFIHGQGGRSNPSSLSVEDLGKGSPEIVRTNSQIVGLNNIHEEPIDFMQDALDVIDSQPRTARGPENYATALKFFTDKYREFPSSHLDKTIIKATVDRCMDGFVEITEGDRPNFVEMTNIYFAVRALPTGSFDKKYSSDIVGLSLEQLPNYSAATLALMIASMSKLDLSETGESAATLVDLALRKASTMDRTANMAQAARTIANLPQTPAAERTFATFLQVRNDLEQPQDLEGLDAINYSLAIIAKDVIQDPALTQQAKSLAERCSALGVRIIRQKENLGDTTPEEISRLKSTVRRIIYNFNQI